VIRLAVEQLECVEGIVVFVLQDTFAAPEPKEAPGAAEAFGVIGVAGFWLLVDQPDHVAGMQAIQGATKFRGKQLRAGDEHISEAADLAQVEPPAAEWKNLSHCGILME
jgi:hypothetical protein